MKKIILFFILFILLFSPKAYAPVFGPPGIAIEEEDGDPKGRCLRIKFANGNLTLNSDGSWSVADQTGAGGGDPILINTTGITDAAGVDLTDGQIGITLNAGVSPDTATFNIKDGQIVAADFPASTDFGDISTGAGKLWELDGNVVGLAELNVTDVSDDIAGDIAEGELTDSSVVSADIKNDTVVDDDMDNSTPADVMKCQFTLRCDGAGSAVTTGAKAWTRIPWNCTITDWDLTVDTSSTTTIDVWMDTYANYPPDNADTITNGHEPAVAAATKAQDPDITDWSDVTLDAGKYIKFNVDANDNATEIVLNIYGYKT